MSPYGYDGDSYVCISRLVAEEVSVQLRSLPPQRVEYRMIDNALDFNPYLQEYPTTPKQAQQLTGGKEVNLVEKVKSLTLSADDKLLRKHNVVNKDGDLTGTGEQILAAILLDEYKAKIVAKVKEAVKEEKK